MATTGVARRTGVVLVMIAAVAAMAMAACGGGDDAPASSPARPQSPAAKAAGTTAASSPTSAQASSQKTAAPVATTSASSPGKVSEVNVIAKDNVFDKKSIEAPANTDFKVTLANQGSIVHNIAFFDKENGSLLSKDAQTSILAGGASDWIQFKTPAPGTYFFVCLIHPQEMKGQFIVK